MRATPPQIALCRPSGGPNPSHEYKIHPEEPPPLRRRPWGFLPKSSSLVRSGGEGKKRGEQERKPQGIRTPRACSALLPCTAPPWFSWPRARSSEGRAEAGNRPGHRRTKSRPCPLRCAAEAVMDRDTPSGRPVACHVHPAAKLKMPPRTPPLTHEPHRALTLNRPRLHRRTAPHRGETPSSRLQPRHELLLSSAGEYRATSGAPWLYCRGPQSLTSTMRTS
jgi:hypothetical protein